MVLRNHPLFNPDKPGVTREALEKQMGELTREYVQSRDKKIDKY
jgi:hypothetical protein